MSKILIVGAGGNGHTYFMDFLKMNGINTNLTDDADGLKHLPRPPDKNTLKKHNITKCIFIYNNPLLCIMSHFRREWAFIQTQKIGNPFNLDMQICSDLDEFINLTNKCGCDIFGIKKQFDNWSSDTNNIPMLFLDFNDVLLQQNSINTFIGKKLNYNNFQIIKRSSVIDKKYKYVYKNIYKNIYKYIKLKSFELERKKRLIIS